MTPAVDPNLFHPYDREHLEGKEENKRGLQELFGLDQKAEGPLLGIVSRLVSHKGMDLIACVLEEMLALGVQVAALGSGDYAYEQFFLQGCPASSWAGGGSNRIFAKSGQQNLRRGGFVPYALSKRAMRPCPNDWPLGTARFPLCASPADLRTVFKTLGRDREKMEATGLLFTVITPMICWRRYPGP